MLKRLRSLSNCKNLKCKIPFPFSLNNSVNQTDGYERIFQLNDTERMQASFYLIKIPRMFPCI